MCSKRDMVERSVVRKPAPTVCGLSVGRGIPAGWPAAIVGLAASLAAGCGSPVPDVSREAVATAAVTPVAEAAAPQAAEPALSVTVRLVDHAGAMKEVASHLGKVVVLDCWSTSCPPCVKEFPELVALAERHGDRVVCVSLAFDYDGSGDPEDLVPPITKFLERVGAGRVTNLIASEPADDLYRKLDLASVPAVYVWKPNGERAIRYDDDMATRDLGRPFTYEDVEKTVAAILAE